MRNKTERKSRTEPEQNSLPRGLRTRFNAGRPLSPFQLFWREGGREKSQSFADEKDRQVAIDALLEKREDHGREILNFDPREWRRWLEFKELLGDFDPFDVLREWKAFKGEDGKSGASTPVPQAVADYVAWKGKQRLSLDTHRHIKKHVSERFAPAFEGVKLRDVTPKKIDTWLDTLTVSRGDREGMPVEPLTRRHHRKDVLGFFDYCVRQGWLARNPCDLVPVPEVEEEDVSLMTVDECRRLFAANAGHRIAGRLALEAFGFMRASSAGRLALEHVNFAERGIRMPGALHKSGKAKFRQGHPDNLWAWLSRAPDDMWPMQWWEYRNEKRDAFVRAGLPPSDNKLRKTCLSAHLAWLKNQPLTSYLAQHRHTSTTDIYLGVMTERDGAAWFQIGPDFISS